MNANAPGRQHAIVMGGGIAGLLAARVLADHFRRVTVLEKDSCPVDGVPRAGVPQGRHIHILLPQGARVLDRLFPGKLVELTDRGAKRFDYGKSRFYVVGTWLPRVDTDLHSFAQTRPLLEESIRRWVNGMANIATVYEVQNSALLRCKSSSRMAGVEYERGGKHEELHAELVIDATGRSTRLPRWLSENGFGNVRETSVGIDLGYATGCFRVPQNVLPDHPMLYIVGPPPHQKRVGVVFQVEDGIVFGGLGGYHGDHPPADRAGFLAFAQSLNQPHVFNVLSQSELCGPIVQFRIPAAVRRSYLSVRNFPDGLLPIGDAICSLDPAFGQGMTMAALEAETLSQSLAENGTIHSTLRRQYLRRVDDCLDVAWDLSCGENFKYSQTTGRRPVGFPITRRYRDFLTTSNDPRVLAKIYKVITLTAPPHSILRPDLAFRALMSKISR